MIPPTHFSNRAPCHKRQKCPVCPVRMGISPGRNMSNQYLAGWHNDGNKLFIKTFSDPVLSRIHLSVYERHSGGFYDQRAAKILLGLTRPSRT